jgi:biopolymer transport protein ExbB
MSRFMRFLPIIALLGVVSASVAFGEEATAPNKGVSLTFFGMIMQAGFPEYVLIAFSMLSFAIAIQNFMVIKKEALVPTGLADDLHQILSKDGITEEAIDNARAMVDNDPSLQGRTLSAALAVSDLGYDAMREAAEDAQASEQTRWMKKPGYVSLFANQATLLGLFGTVWGIIESFMAMAANPAGVDIGTLSKTIGVSLITTANGMFIAVPMLAFAFMQRQSLIAYFNEANDGVKEILNYFRAPDKAR